MDLKELEMRLEAVLFAVGHPVTAHKLCALLGVDAKTLHTATAALSDYYRFEQRGMRVVRMDNAYQMISAPEMADFVRAALEERRPQPLSKPALEVLSIIAYYQPVTKVQIEQLRGVDSSGTVQSLLEKELVAEAGRLEVPGRPILYKTTPAFLRSFGIASLDELPALSREDEQAEGQLTLPEVERDSEGG